LREEYEAGRKLLAELDSKRATVNNTLLRIEGAVQVLGELAAGDGGVADGAVPTALRPTAR
jgi:hypothetical protein